MLCLPLSRSQSTCVLSNQSLNSLVCINLFVVVIETARSRAKFLANALLSDGCRGITNIWWCWQSLLLLAAATTTYYIHKTYFSAHTITFDDEFFSMFFFTSRLLSQFFLYVCIAIPIVCAVMLEFLSVILNTFVAFCQREWTLLISFFFSKFSVGRTWWTAIKDHDFIAHLFQNEPQMFFISFFLVHA